MSDCEPHSHKSLTYWTTQGEADGNTSMDYNKEHAAQAIIYGNTLNVPIKRMDYSCYFILFSKNES